jgi:methyl-accepting chemotaxis protein
MKLSDLKIRTRLGLNLAMVIGFNVLVTGVSIWSLSDVAESTDSMVDVNQKQALAQDWLQTISSNTIRTFARAKSYDPEVQEYFKKEMEWQSEQTNKIQKELEEKITNADAKKLMENIANKRKEYTEARKEFFEIKAKKGKENEVELNKLLEQNLVPKMHNYVKSIQELVDLEKKIFVESHQHVLDVGQSSRNIMLLCGLLAITTGSILAWLLSRSITKPLNYAVEIAQTVASGNLNKEIKIDSKDETGQLLLALKEMNAKLVDIVGQIRVGTDVISTASTQIAAGNLDLSSRTEEQASSLEETASAMEELTSTVQQNADNAKQANQLANSASEISKRGGAVVSKVVDTMKDIDESSKKIVDIISVIDSIAFQTNILALNAAVEAARAGEQGRGFAVVATEVRNLAQKSAAAAKEIKELISNSVQKVQNGVILVDEAGNTMSKVVESIKRVTDIVDEISSASSEQAVGIEQVNQAISQMDQVTQQNAALVEEAAAASASMQNEADNLSKIVSIFKI